MSCRHKLLEKRRYSPDDKFHGRRKDWRLKGYLSIIETNSQSSRPEEVVISNRLWPKKKERRVLNELNKRLMRLMNCMTSNSKQIHTRLRHTLLSGFIHCNCVSCCVWCPVPKLKLAIIRGLPNLTVALSYS